MLQHTPTSDQEKIQLKKLLDGDEKAFDYFYDHYSLAVYRKLLKMIKIEFVAEEILQNVFIKLWEKRHLIDPEKGLKCYLYQIAQNMAYDFYRHLAREDRLKAEIRYSLSDITDDAAGTLLLKESQQLLEKAIEQLPEQQKIVFRLCKQEGKTYDEVSKMLGISKSTINGHVVRATRKIKAIMFNSHHISYSVILTFLSILIGEKN